MSSAPAPGLAPSEKDPLFSLAQRLPEAQDREWYGQLVSYIQSLQPSDELVKIAQLFGFLTMLGYQLPEAIAAEQNKMREFLLQAYEDLQQEVKTNARYHEKLNARLNQLPGEIAAGVKPEAIAKAMSESFRQQIRDTGLQDTKAFLTEATKNLKTVAAELDKAVKPLITQYGDLASTLQSKADILSSAAGRLQNSTQAVDSKNSQLLHEIQDRQGWILLAAAFLLLVVGAFCGALWEQHQFTSYVADLQGQIQQLQESIKALPAALTPPPSKFKAKKIRNQAGCRF